MSTADKLIRVYPEDAQRLEEIRRALVMQAGGAHRSIADAVHELVTTPSAWAIRDSKPVTPAGLPESSPPCGA